MSAQIRDVTKLSTPVLGVAQSLYSRRAKNDLWNNSRTSSSTCSEANIQPDTPRQTKPTFVANVATTSELEEGILYYRRNVLNENEPWRICVHTEDEKKRVLESCHSGVEG